MKKNAVIVVTYNRKELLKLNLKALMEQSYNDFDIIVVDNNSNDGTGEYVKGLNNDRIKYFNTEKNIGGAGGFNYGVRKAIENKYDYAWLMDDDTIPEKDSLKSIMKKVEILDDNFSYISSIVEWTDHSICKMNKQIINENFLENYKMVKEGLIELERASFVACFINLDIANKVGLPIKEFFIYGDDWEYTLRLINEKKAFLDTESIVMHKMKENSTASIVDIPQEKIDRCFYNYRNSFYISKRCGKKATIKYILRYFVDLLKVIVMSKNKKIKRVYVMTKGLICGINFNPKIEYVE